MTHRILMVGDSYPPLIGGATRAVQLLGKELTARGHSVSVATPWQPGLALEEDDDGVAVHRIKGLASRVTIFSADPARRHHPPFPDVMTTVSLRRILNAFRPDIVHAFGWMTYSCATALIGTGIPLILSARDYSNVCAVRTLIQASDEGERICEGPSPAKCIACASREYGVLKGVAAVGGVLAGRPLLRSKISALHSCSYYIEDVMNRFLLDGPHLASSSHAPLRAVIPDFREDVSGAAVDRDLLSQLPDTPFILFVGALRLCKGLEPLFEAYGRLTDPPPLILMGTRNTDTPSNFPSGVHVFYSVPHPTVMAAWD
ncbi:MAG: glycosyltransferase, partial [Chloroflexota bacterium]